MHAIVSRLRGQIYPQLDAAGRRAAARIQELSTRAVEAARDARHRLRTGRPRGMPAAYIHPPLPCSSECSNPARRVHGLLYGYSLAYREVRPKVDTIAEVLGYGRSTVYAAIGELKRAELLTVHERRGKDERRIANRYDVHVRAGNGARPSAGGGRSSAERTRKEISDLRSRVGGSSSDRATDSRPKNRGSPPERSAAAALPGLLGEARFRRLEVKLGGHVSDVLAVAFEEHAAELPGAFRTVMDRLIEGTHVENPAGYVRAALRGEWRTKERLELELAEVEAQHLGAKAEGDVQQIAKLARAATAIRRRLAELKGAASPERLRPLSAARPAPAVERQPVTTNLADVATAADELLRRLRGPTPRAAAG